MEQIDISKPSSYPGMVGTSEKASEQATQGGTRPKEQLAGSDEDE